MIIYTSKFKTEGLHGLDKHLEVKKSDDNFSVYVNNGLKKNFNSLEKMVDYIKNEGYRLSTFDYKTFQLASEWMYRVVNDIETL